MSHRLSLAVIRKTMRGSSRILYIGLDVGGEGKVSGGRGGRRGPKTCDCKALRKTAQWVSWNGLRRLSLRLKNGCAQDDATIEKQRSEFKLHNREFQPVFRVTPAAVRPRMLTRETDARLNTPRGDV